MSIINRTYVRMLAIKILHIKAILKEPQFDGAYKVNARDGFRGAFYLEEYDVYVSTSYGIGDIIRFIEKLLAYAGVRDNEVKISFKA